MGKHVIPYVRTEGAGNICLVLESKDLPTAEAERRALIQAIAERGQDFAENPPQPAAEPAILAPTDSSFADQVLVVFEKNPLHFEIWNRDGSRAKMCGNGSRAILLVGEKYGWWPAASSGQKVPFSISGTPYFGLRREEPGHYAVNLGIPKVSDRRDFFHEGIRVPYWPVSVGNNHAVIFCGRSGDWALPSTFRLDEWGPRLSSALHANIEFVQELRPREKQFPHPQLQTLVWEIGAGATLACGSGAVACAAAWQRKNQSLQPRFSLHMPGGILEVSIGPDGTLLEGPTSILEAGVFNSI